MVEELIWDILAGLLVIVPFLLLLFGGTYLLIIFPSLIWGLITLILLTFTGMLGMIIRGRF